MSPDCPRTVPGLSLAHASRPEEIKKFDSVVKKIDSVVRNFDSVLIGTRLCKEIRLPPLSAAAAAEAVPRSTATYGIVQYSYTIV